MKILFMIFLIAPVAAQESDYLIPEKFAVIVIHWCAETGVPIYIASAIIREESRWDPNRVNVNPARKHRRRTVDRGLMQLNSENDRLFSQAYNDGLAIDYFDPETNVKVGLRFLADLYRTYGTWRKALSFYNSGCTLNPPESTRRLVDKELQG